jgi:hypothetical protein
VILLGAGASHDAGIPLLGGFVDQMWEFSKRKTANGKPISAEDIEIFEEALSIRNELGTYHGRAYFDDRNIEDILSILSFNVLGGDKRAKAKQAAFNKAITRTIELACNVTHSGVSRNGQNKVQLEGSPLYRQFWKSIFQWCAQHKSPPTILTFNYDLVLERSLLQVLIGTELARGGSQLPFDAISIDYHHEHAPTQNFKIKHARFSKSFQDHENGSILEPVDGALSSSVVTLNLLKLHGSVNFPSSKMTALAAKEYNIAAPCQNPNILPPIFNKLSTNAPSEIWKTGLTHLREAANLIIVGYSLPKTDIYMQYFLKAGLGPNIDLNKVVVFDPALWRDSSVGEGMKARYEDCFAPQIRGRICFRPEKRSERTPGGTFENFVATLAHEPGFLLFA